MDTYKEMGMRTCNTEAQTDERVSRWRTSVKMNRPCFIQSEEQLKHVSRTKLHSEHFQTRIYNDLHCVGHDIVKRTSLL